MRRDVHGIWVNDKPAATRGRISLSRQRPAKEGRPEKMDLTPLSPLSPGTDPAAGELAVDLPADLKFVTLVLRLSTAGEAAGDLHSPATAVAGHWAAGIRAALAVGTAAGLCRCSYGPGFRRAAVAYLQPPPLPAGLPGTKRRPIGFQPFAPRGLAIGAALAETEDRHADPGRTAETAGWTQFPIDLTDGTSTRDRGPPRAIDAGGLDALSGHRRHRQPGAFPAALSPC